MPPKKNTDKDKTIQTTLSNTMTRSRAASEERERPPKENQDNPQVVINQGSETEITKSNETLADLTKKALELSNSRHTLLPKTLLNKHKDSESAYEEGTPIPARRITSKQLLEFKIAPYNEEIDLPNFYNATDALHYFRVLRDLMFNWTKAKGHERTLRESLMSDQTPPGLRIKKNIEVIDCSPRLRLRALQILGHAENELTHAILNHYETLIPTIENNIQEIYENMEGVNEDE